MKPQLIRSYLKTSVVQVLQMWMPHRLVPVIVHHGGRLPNLLQDPPQTRVCKRMAV